MNTLRVSVEHYAKNAIQMSNGVLLGICTRCVLKLKLEGILIFFSVKIVSKVFLMALKILNIIVYV